MTMTTEEKQARKVARHEARRIQKELARIEEERNQKPVSEITITIEWKRSRMWGMNPNAEAVVVFADGTATRRNGFKASGCGYDKESTVIGEIFNTFLKYKLYEFPNSRFANSRPTSVENPLPYGMHSYSEDSRDFGQGIGTSCYYEIAKAIGGKFEQVASGKTFDVYKFTMVE